MKGKLSVKNIILWTITFAAVLTIIACVSGIQVWDGCAWVDPEPFQILPPILLSLGWLIAFGKANEWL